MEATQMSDQLTLFAEASRERARTSVSPERAQALRVAARDYGRSSPELLARYVPDTSSSKTSPTSCRDGAWLTDQMDLASSHGWEEYLGTWPRSGLMRNGTAYQLPPLVRLTDEIGCGLWPTPVAPNGGRSIAHVDTFNGRTAYHKGQKVQVDLNQAVKMWPTPTNKGNYNKAGLSAKSGDGLATAVKMCPTPTADRYSGLQSHGQNAILGSLNPTWVEWLMGFPLGWTDCEPSVMQSSRKSRKSSDGQ